MQTKQLRCRNCKQSFEGKRDRPGKEWPDHCSQKCAREWWQNEQSKIVRRDPEIKRQIPPGIALKMINKP